MLTHWGRVTHICVSKSITIVSDKGLSPGRRQASIWTNTGIFFIGPLGANFSEIVIDIHTPSFKKIHLKMSSGKWRPFCLGLIVLTWFYDMGDTHSALVAAKRGICWSMLETSHKRVGNTKLWSFLCCYPEQVVGKSTVELPVIWDSLTPMWHHCEDVCKKLSEFLRKHRKQIFCIWSTNDMSITCMV